ncbi:MAG: hypothetical protein MJ175_11650, partial [Clostridia bacterium]|nr:hypothetical protein [Clostridia bacterium]
MKNHTRFTAATLLLASMLATALASCGDTAKTPAETQAKDNTPANTAAVTEAVTEPVDLAVANVPADLNYGGFKFSFIISGNIENNRQKNDFYSEGENGEALNDAIFPRNLLIDDRLTITIDTSQEYDTSNT